MLTSLRQQTRGFWVETAVLVVSAPLLILPERWPLLSGVALALLVCVWLGRWWATRQPLPPSPFNLLLLIWSLILIVAMSVTADPELTFPKTMGLILGLAVWRYCLLYVTTVDILHWVLLGYFVLGVALTAFGLLNVAWIPKVPFLDDLVRWLSVELGVGQLSQGENTVHSNQIAGTLLFFLPLAVALFIWWRPVRWGKLILGALVGLFVAFALIMLLSQSRAGWVGTAVGIASLPWFYALTQRDQPFWRRLSWFLPLVGALATAVAFVIFWPSLQAIWNDPNVDTAVGNLNTLAFRKVVWTWGLTAVGDFPFTGTGLGSFRAVAPRLYPLPIFVDISHAHNMLLQIALDMGLPGLATYLALVGLMAYTGWRVACTRHPLFRPLSIGLLANLVALHTYGLLDTLALGSKTGIFLWLTLGLLTAVFRQTHPPARN